MGRRRSRRNSSGRVHATLVGKSHGATSALAAFGKRKKKGPKDVITPPYDPEALYKLYENSSLLRPNIEAYITNIDSFGHHLIPAIDLVASDANTRIKDAIHYERFLAARTQGEVDPLATPEPSDTEVAHRKEDLQKIMRLEFARLQGFFKFACPETSFVELRRHTRQDLEVTGNAYWEILRNKLGEILRIKYVPPIDMRLTGKDSSATPTIDKVKVTDITWIKYRRKVNFRRFVQIDRRNNAGVYFKQFGDPRVISRDTGCAYTSVESMRAKEPDAKQATEILHFRIFTPSSPYGIPRWTPNLPSVLGSRELDEVNLNYFKNNVVPPLALLVSGGRFSKGVASKIEEFIDEHLKGKKGLHRILVLEAEGQKAAGEPGPKLVPRVQFVPLRDAQQQDALFQEYDKRNEEKVSQSFRMPRFLRGDDTQTNRATAFANLRFAEDQVFNPEREWFDNIINRQLLSDLDITFWEFRSNAPVTRDPEQMAKMISELTQSGVITPQEARELTADVFNRAFVEIAEDWTNRPLPFTIAQLRGNNNPPVDIAAPSTSLMNPEQRSQTQQTQQSSNGSNQMRRAGQPLASMSGSKVKDDEV